MQVEQKVKNFTRSVKILSPLKSSKKQEEKKQNKKTKTNQEKNNLQPYPAISSQVQQFPAIYKHFQPFPDNPAIYSNL